jgi:hypothetical protein
MVAALAGLGRAEVNDLIRAATSFGPIVDQPTRA